jgi:hypothetical protein
MHVKLVGRREGGTVSGYRNHRARCFASEREQGRGEGSHRHNASERQLIGQHVMFVETNSDAERRTRVDRVLHLELECALPVAVVVHAIVSSAEQLETSVRQEKQLECREGTMVIEEVLYDTGRDLLTPVCIETVGQYRLAWAGWVTIAEIDEIDQYLGRAGHIQKKR